MTQLKIIVEKHPGGYIAYPEGQKGVIVAQGATFEVALSNVKSAMRSHTGPFAEETSSMDPAIIEAFVTETGVKVWW